MRVEFAAHVIYRLHDLDAAGLAAAAGVNLRLDHPDRAAELVRGLSASSTENAGMPCGTGTPNSRRTALA